MATISNVPKPAYVYDLNDDAWYPIGGLPQAFLTVFEFTATAAQTTFTGADNNTLTLAYITGGISVYLNGALLTPTDDYTATTGTSVVLVSGATLNDILVVEAIGTFQVADTYTRSEVDARLSSIEALALLGL